MAYNLKAWVVVCFLIFLARWFLKPTFCPTLLGDKAFDNLTWLWLALTTAVLLSFNFWLFCFVTAAIFLFAGHRIPPLVALCGMLYCAPYNELVIPGIGGINYLAALSYPRVLMFGLIALYYTNSEKSKGGESWGGFDSLVISIGVLNFFLAYRDDTLTNSLRVIVYHMLDIFGIYWVGRQMASRQETLRSALSAFSLGVCIIGLIGIFEFSKKWLLYAHVDTSWGAPGSDVYLMRGDTGMLRSYATTTHPLALGYVTALCTLVWLAIAQSASMTLRQSWRPLAVIAAGLLVTVSRGPWLCLAAAYLLWLLVQPKGFALVARSAIVGALLFGAILLTPAGDSVVKLLPFVGNVESGNIDYRKLLVEVSWMVVMEHPWFGSNTFMYEPIMQQLIQGQGIIDLVNHYVSTALASGFVGVALFVMAHVGPALLGIKQVLMLRGIEGTPKSNPELDADLALLRGLSCALVASAMALATTSAITVIPWTAWLLTGACVTVLARVQKHSAALNRPAWKPRLT
jgi:hypothetical protein